MPTDKELQASLLATMIKETEDLSLHLKGMNKVQGDSVAMVLLAEKKHRIF